MFSKRALAATLVVALAACSSAGATRGGRHRPPPTTTTSTRPVTTTTAGTVGAAPPPAGGYFTLAPVGATLPNDCASRVHLSTWEPRPDNTKRDHTTQDPNAIHASLAARQYDSSWRNWNVLRQRIDGQYAGTTDEIFQWAACKWGLPDDLLRAIAVDESTWYQYETYPSGRCVTHFSCGDFFTTTDADHLKFCNAIDQFGYAYQHDYGAGFCPRTFSIVGIMSWDAPAWEAPNPPFPDNQNGTFPFNRDSTAFAVDYIGQYLRGCYDGDITWLGPSGDIWGCVGSWYSGAWHDAGAQTYISHVQGFENTHAWLDPSWPTNRPGCSAQYGCPGPDPL